MSRLLPSRFIFPLVIILLSYIFLFKSSFVRADYQKAYTDYTYSYSLYRQAHNDYQIAKSTFLTYRTLVSQNEAINKLRAVLKARDQVILSYYNLLQEKMNATEGLNSEAKNTFFEIKNSELAWLAGHQTKIEAASSLEDLSSVSGEFESRYSQIDTETKQTIGAILSAKEETLSKKVSTLSTNVSEKLTEIRQAGEETAVLERGLINVNNKLTLHSEKMTQVKSVFTAADSYRGIDLFRGQQRLTEANQYLREAVNFLLEIIKSITG